MFVSSTALDFSDKTAILLLRLKIQRIYLYVFSVFGLIYEQGKKRISKRKEGEKNGRET